MLQVVFIVSPSGDYRFCLLCPYRSTTGYFSFLHGELSVPPWRNEKYPVEERFNISGFSLTH